MVWIAQEDRGLVAIPETTHAGMLRAVSATKDHAVCFHAMADHATTTVVALRRERMNRALEAIERVRSSVGDDFESLVVIVSTNFTA